MSYYREGQIKDRLLDYGVVPIEISDDGPYMQEFRGGRFSLEDITADWIKAEKANPKTAHRWTSGATDADADQLRRAFVDGHPDTQGDVVKRYGEKRARELAQTFQTTLGSTKRGVDPNPPDAETEKKHASNPWAATAANIDKNGRYTNEAIHRQFSASRAMGVDKAKEVAAIVNSRPGDLRPGMLKSKA